MDKTAQVSGRIILRILTKTNSFKMHVIFEMKAHRIKMSKKQEKVWTLVEKRVKVRQNEHSCCCEKDPDYSRENVVKDVTYTVPLSRMLKSPESFQKQEDILDKEAGITSLK